MRDDVHAPCASVCEGKAIQAPLQGKRKSWVKNSLIVHGAWAKEGQKPFLVLLPGPIQWEQLFRLSRAMRTATMGISGVLALCTSLVGMGRSGRDFLLHAELS